MTDHRAKRRLRVAQSGIRTLVRLYALVSGLVFAFTILVFIVLSLRGGNEDTVLDRVLLAAIAVLSVLSALAGMFGKFVLGTAALTALTCLVIEVLCIVDVVRTGVPNGGVVIWSLLLILSVLFIVKFVSLKRGEQQALLDIDGPL